MLRETTNVGTVTTIVRARRPVCDNQPRSNDWWCSVLHPTRPWTAVALALLHCPPWNPIVANGRCVKSTHNHRSCRWRHHTTHNLDNHLFNFPRNFLSNSIQFDCLLVCRNFFSFFLKNKSFFFLKKITIKKLIGFVYWHDVMLQLLLNNPLF